MRLIHRADDGTLELTDDLLNDGVLPPYAILAHRWGREEATYQDMMKGEGKHKAVYDKILFCSQQAAAHGLRYFCVNTCCINKRDRAEGFEAINLMFRWYKNAVRCYVYLQDVSTISRVETKGSSCS